MEIALFEPEIPPNTGNIIRLSVCTGSTLHIVGKPSFSLEDSMLRRAGLDYWNLSRLTSHESLEHFLDFLQQRDSQSRDQVRRRFVLTTRFAKSSFSDFAYEPDQILLFGKETSRSSRFRARRISRNFRIIGSVYRFMQSVGH